MKLPLFAAIAFVVGLAGGTGVGVATAPKPVPAADSTHAAAKSTASGHETPSQHDAVAASATGQVPTSVPHDSASTHEAERSATAAESKAEAHPAPIGAPAIGAALSSASHEPEDFRQVARILTTMKPSDAAKIMGFLGDDHVEGILRAVGPRQAAVLMVQIPAPRAAALTKRLIARPTPEKP